MNKYDNDVTRMIMEENILKNPTRRNKKKKVKKEIKKTIFNDISNFEVIFMFLYIFTLIMDVLTSISKIGNPIIKKNIFNSNFIYIITFFVLMHSILAFCYSLYLRKKYNYETKDIIKTLVKPILLLVLTLIILIIRVKFINKYL